MKIGTTDYIISSFNNGYTSGINWKFVAGKPHAIDYGSDTGHWISSITLIGTPSNMIAARTALLANITEGCQITFEPYETVFGPEIDYTNALTCWVTDIGSISQPLNNEATFAFTIKASLRNYIIFGPNGYLQVVTSKLDRRNNDSFISHTTMGSMAATDFKWQGPTCDIEWYATLPEAQQLRRFLLDARGSVVTLIRYQARAYYFNVINPGYELAYVLNIGPCTPSDMSSNHYTLSATVGKA